MAVCCRRAVCGCSHGPMRPVSAAGCSCPAVQRPPQPRVQSGSSGPAATAPLASMPALPFGEAWFGGIWYTLAPRAPVIQLKQQAFTTQPPGHFPATRTHSPAQPGSKQLAVNHTATGKLRATAPGGRSWRRRSPSSLPGAAPERAACGAMGRAGPVAPQAAKGPKTKAGHSAPSH